MAAPSGDGLIRWLVGGLVLGGILLGFLVAVYEIGYSRGRDSAAPVTTTAPTTTAATTTSTTSSNSAAVRGQYLYTADACSSCHSLDGTNGVGPTFKGLAGSIVTLSDGSTITADDAYLAKSITDPDAQIVEGFQRGVMSASISSFGLSAKPQYVAALVAFIKSRR
jgi:cytochrome c oxidase subunit 2